MWVQISGMKKLEQSVKPGNYQTLWCAGQSVELINDILPCGKIINRMKDETEEAFRQVAELSK